jgi:RimJ/RimL family protein N-acetyltransferase
MIRLELLDESHLGQVDTLLDDPDVLRFTRIPVPVPNGFSRHWLDTYARARRDGSREAFAAFDAEGAFAGLALAPEIDREGEQLELGYIVAPGARGRGLGTAILRALTAWAFEEVGAQRIFLLISVENAASLRVAERCGYVKEGVMRSLHVKQGIRGDTTLWSRLPSDPDPAAR